MEGGDVKLYNACTLFVVCKTCHIFQSGVICHGVTVVMQSHSVVAYAIDSSDIALVLNSSCRNKCIPILYAYVGPVGYHQEDIIVITAAVACPNRETQVIANQQLYLHSFIFKGVALTCLLKELILTAMGIQVAFILYLHLAVWHNHKSAVDQLRW